MLTPEGYRSAIVDHRNWYRENAAFATFVDAAARTEGVIVDIATGPGGSFSGALAPLLRPEARFIMTDAAVHVLRGLKGAWEEETCEATLDFVACDGLRLPFRSDSVDALTSNMGFDCATDDPTRSTPPGAGKAYREGHRVLKPGGMVFTQSCIYDEHSKTAGHLASLGCDNASLASLSACWQAIGFDTVCAIEISRATGKMHWGDALPVDDQDSWRVMASVLRKR